jgi:hypothetical protein
MPGRILTLRHLECIHPADPSEGGYFGCDQNWYPTDWQRTAGCAPTTISTILAYLQASGRIVLPTPILRRADCLPLMETVWDHVTPSEDGVSRIEPFCEGIGRFAQANGIALSCRSLAVPPAGLPRPTSAVAADFIREALAGDSPVAFLNLDSGQVGNLEDWHWVTVVGMEESAEEPRIRLRVYDGDREETVDYGLWHRTTAEGGALVYLLPGG